MIIILLGKFNRLCVLYPAPSVCVCVCIYDNLRPPFSRYQAHKSRVHLGVVLLSNICE